MRDAAVEYQARPVQVVAVNPGTLESHQQWSQEFGFQFPICVDEGKQVATAYGAIKPESGGIQRSVFVVDRQGNVAWAQTGAPETSDILAAIDAAG